MKVIIAGSRSITDYDLVASIIKRSKFDITEIVCGGAAGVDNLGALYGRRNNIPRRYFQPDWDIYGNSAGIKRNVIMGDYADAAIIIWDGSSKGTRHMLEYMQRINKPVELENINA